MIVPTGVMAMDELAEEIAKTLAPHFPPSMISVDWVSGEIANAVRAYLASDGVVERAALGIENAGRMSLGFPALEHLIELSKDDKADALMVARAGLTAATKGDGDGN